MEKRSLWLVASLLAVLLALALWRSADTGGDPGSSASRELDPARQRLQRFWRTYDRATDLRTQGDWEGASRLYEEALELNPRHEESLYYLGNCRFERGEYSRAAKLYRRLVQINPESNRGHSQLGAVLSSPWPGAPVDFEEAEKAFLKSARLYPEESGAFVRLGRLALARGRREAALEYFDQAAGFRSAEAVFWAGFVRYQSGKYRQAAKLFQKVLEGERRERRMSDKGAVSEGDTAPSPAAGGAKGPKGGTPTHLQSAAIHSRAFLYWCAQRLDGYPGQTAQEFRLQSPPKAEIVARDVTVAAGLDPQRLGRGAWADYDGDGYEDLAVASPETGLTIYRNRSGVLQAQSLHGRIRLETAWDLAWGDYDGDGRLDLYVAASGYTGRGRNRLLHSRDRDWGTDTFQDVTASSGLDGERATARVLFLDFDGDGRLDLLEAGNSETAIPALRLFRNEPERGFRECSHEAGIVLEGNAVDIAWGDYDGDTHPDLLVLRWKRPAILYRNKGDGSFADLTESAGLQGVGGNGFFGLFLDADRDGLLDLLITQQASYADALSSLMPGKSPTAASLRLFRNRNGRSFEEITSQAGLVFAHGVMQVAAADLNQDGWDDLVVANGSPDPSRLEPSLLLLNRQGRFELSGYVPAYDRPANASGVSLVDFHNDGYPEIYLAGVGLFQLR